MAEDPRGHRHAPIDPPGGPSPRASVPGLDRPPAAGPSRRRFLGSAAAGWLLASAPGLGLTLLRRASRAEALGLDLTEGRRLTLRSLWDASVPGTWNGVVEDELEPGVPAPGADDARVQEWLEQVAGTLPRPLDGLTTGFLAFWADDLDLWADVFHGRWFDGAPKFWQLPLDPSPQGRGRQHKVILMQALFHTVFDLEYLGAMLLARMAFFCDLWFERNEPEIRVGRAYIGFPLPPGTTPYTGVSYQRTLNDGDPRLVRVGSRDLVAAP